MRLSGWQRLWVFMSITYFLVVLAFAFYDFPQPKYISVDDVYTKLSPKSRAIIVTKKNFLFCSSCHGMISIYLSNGGSIDFIDKGARKARGFRTYTINEAHKPEDVKKWLEEKDVVDATYEYCSIREQETTKQRVIFILEAFLFWLIPCVFAYGLGRGVGWVYKGFKG